MYLTFRRLKELPKGTGKRGHIVAHDVTWAAQTGKHLLRTQNVSEQNQEHFCVPDTKFVSATNVARAGKRGNMCRQQCFRNNVSSFASTFKVAPYSFTIARALMTKAQVICAAQRKTSVFLDFYDVNMSTKSKIESKFSRVSFGDFFLNLSEL